MSVWPTIALRDAGKWLSGGTPKRDEPSFWGGTVPWIGTKDLKSFELDGSSEFVTEEGADTGSRVVDAGTVLFATRGMSLAKEFRVGIATRRVAFNQDVKAIVPRRDVEGRFLAWFLRSQGQYVLDQCDTATHGTKRLPLERIDGMPVPVPPLPEQRRIAAILDEADALRRKRREALALLDDLLRATFLDMFGDVWDGRFPLAPIGTLGHIQMGRQRAPKYQTGESTRRYLRVANVRMDELRLDDVLEMDFGIADRETYRLVHGDILLNEGQSTELVGRPALWRDELPECYFQNPLLRFRCAPRVTTPEYMVDIFLKLLRSGIFAAQSAKTSNMAHLGASRFARIAVPVPPLADQIAWSTLREAIRTERLRVAPSLGAADSLFSSLLHRAFTGDL